MVQVFAIRYMYCHAAARRAGPEPPQGLPPCRIQFFDFSDR